jgi:polyhydroxyalkanoate synthesis regulator phasin
MQISTKAYKVIKTANTNSYTLYLQPPNSVYMNELYESITQTNILSHAFYNEEDNEADNEADNDEETQESISFTAESVKPLSVLLKKGKLTNQETTKMIHDLSKQIAYLETKMQQTFYGYNLDDILVINEDIFFIASTKNLARIETKNNSIYFYKPIDKPYFSNPELNELTKLPAKIDYRSSYYSLGALILFCSTNIYIFSELKETDIILSPIYYTKLYWFLKRCFHEDCKQRILLFI